MNINEYQQISMNIGIFQKSVVYFIFFKNNLKNISQKNPQKQHE
jgi:hypothetical protein